MKSNITKLIIVIFLLVAMISSPVFSMTTDRPKIGLVLSGGGAKGFAHIGTLTQIPTLTEELGTDLDLFDSI